MKLFGPSATPIKYSNNRTKYSSLHGFMAGAEINEVNPPPTKLPFETPENYAASNIRSGVNVTDLPNEFGDRKGMRKIGPQVFTPDDEQASWKRIRGEVP